MSTASAALAYIASNEFNLLFIEVSSAIAKVPRHKITRSTAVFMFEMKVVCECE